MSFSIRKASLSDAPALADLLRQISWWSAFEEKAQADKSHFRHVPCTLQR